MGGEDLNCEWNNHNAFLAQQLNTFYNTSDFVDVTLVCDGNKLIKAHKVVLSACSDSFKKIFKEQPSTGVVFLRSVCFEEMESIIKFIYTGQSRVQEEMLPNVLHLATELKVHVLSVDEESILQPAQFMPRAADAKNRPVKSTAKPVGSRPRHAESIPRPDVSNPTPSVSTTPRPSVSTTPRPSVSTTPRPAVFTTPRPAVFTTPRPAVFTTPMPTEENPVTVCPDTAFAPVVDRTNSQEYYGGDVLPFDASVDENLEGFVCEVCSGIYCTQKVLNRHKRIHDANPKTYPCEFCGKVYGRKDSLGAHVKTHRRES